MGYLSPGPTLHAEEKQSSGFVMVTVAFLVMILVGIAALVSDALLALSSHEQLRHTCEYGALSALKIYRDTASGSTQANSHEQKLDQVSQRINQLVTFNMMISPHVDLASPPFRDFGIDKSSLESSGDPESYRRPGGLLTPGRWLRGALAHADVRCSGKDPCFVRTQYSDIFAATPARFPNAFQCQGSLSSPIRAVLGRIIGTEMLSFQATAVATDAPRDIIMALDLSSSMVSVHHQDENPQTNPPIMCPANYLQAIAHPGYASEFAWYYPEILSQADGIPELYFYKYLTMQVTLDTPLVMPGTGPYLGATCGSGASWRQVKDIWPLADQNRLLKPFQRPGPTIPSLHYMSDYAFVEFRSPSASANTKCDTWYASLSSVAPAGVTIPRHVVFNERADAFGNLAERCTFVDLYTHATAPFEYKGAEPFTSLTEGVDAAIQALSAFQGRGDRIGILPFDQAVFPLPSVQDSRPPLRSIPLSDPQTTWNHIHPSPDPLPQLNDYIQMGIFPRHLNTNISLGVKEALEQFGLSESPGKKLIILFTDGLANCTANAGNGCENTPQNYLSASNELRGRFLSSLQNDQVELVVIMVPHSRSSVFPDIQERAHTFNIQRDEYEACCSAAGASAQQIDLCSPSCANIIRWMSDKDAMASGLEFVETRMSSYLPGYLGPHKLVWDLAKGSGGRYFAMRPQPPVQSCNPLTGETNCADTDPLDPSTCIPRSPFRQSDGSPQRQFLDPFCRSLSAQVEQSLGEIINEPTLKLVQ